ncbi:MAG: hypothetical protein JMDDDDMK_01356 [Acidobacteria bacterium]|nr:hypothetical protein [Acidobacteriota bacterium]
MRLPEHIYHAVKPHFSHHAAWHEARLSNAPENHFPGLIKTDKPGSGEQFLRFHREMIRVFKWIIANTPGPQYRHVPWEKLPDWLANLFEAAQPNYLTAAYAEIDRLIVEGTADELGNFIEATGVSQHPHKNIHNRAHGTIAGYENLTFGANNARLADAKMNNFSSAPHNEHFWGLHGWIDDVFAKWQQQHGETVDQSPLQPDHSGHMHLLSATHPAPPALSPAEVEHIFRPIWD